jgi:multidrug efflux pump subunit AcrB
LSKSHVNFRIEDSHFSCVVKRPVAILMVTLAVGVFGWVSYHRLALTLMPNMSYPTLTVRTIYPGTAPEEIENVISRPLEQQLGIIPKLVSISSTSKAGQSDVMLEFQWKTDMDAIAQDVREKIDRVRFPDGAERPLLLHYDPSLDPILRLGLAGPQSLYALRYLAENDIKRRIESLPGIAAVKVKGGLEEQFLVAIDESKLANLKLDITQIGARLQAGNVNMPGGNLREGQTEYLIRTLNEFRTIEEIGALIIARQNNVDIRLRDIASVTSYHEDRTIITRVNGNESVEIEIYKEADANVLLVAQAVREALFGTPEQQLYVANLKKPAVAPAAAKDAKAKDAKSPAPLRPTDPMQLMAHRRNTDFIAYQIPPGATLQLLSDQSVFIKNSIDEVKNNAVEGGLIAIAVLYLFLRNITQTLIVSLCIPVSILATFAPMYMTNVSLNVISLGGIAVGVGNLLDNSIVVLESIFRCREEGDDPMKSVVRGISEVAMPVIASTATAVAVFFPIVFVEGVAGQVFGDMALTVVFSHLASLIAALYLTPMLAAQQAGMSGLAHAGTGVIAQIRGSDYLQFPALAPGGSRLMHAGRTLGVVGRRIFWAVAVMLATMLKSVSVLLAAFWPVPRVAAWTARDDFGPIAGAHVWPGMLNFAGLEELVTGMKRTARWFVAGSRGRWIGLLLAPGIAVAAFLATRTWLLKPDTTPAPAPLLPPGMPGGAPWYMGVKQWFMTMPWWGLLLIFVPGVLPFAFLVARFVLATVFRLVGAVGQAAVLLLAMLVIGLVRAIGVLIARVTGSGLDWVGRANNWMHDEYPGLIRASLRHRGAVIGGSFAAFALCCVLLVPRLGSELIPQAHQGEFNLDVSLPIGTPLERTAEVAGQIEERVLKIPGVERTAFVAGAEEGSTSNKEAGEHTAQITVKLNRNQDAKGEFAVIDRMRTEFRDLPEVKVEISYPALFSFKSPVEVEIRGHDLNTLKRLSREAETLLANSVSGLVDVRSTLQSGHPEIEVVYDRDRLAEYGLTLRSVADLVRNKVQGRVATEFRQEDRLIDIVVRLREQDRFGLEELQRLVVNPAGAVPIPLSAVAKLTVNEGPSEIRRVDQQRTALITANIRGSDLATVSRQIVAAMETLNYPAGFTYNVAGQNAEMRTSLNSLLLAFALAVFLVYIVMASQFESLVQPLLIMMTVPLALIGVVLVLWAFKIPVSIMVFLGLIILVGIVVNNAIVLIDYINKMRERGLPKAEAIIEAGRARLRPIIMTALTTVVGLIPMALGIGEGAEIRAPMAITVIVGLTVATLLTLVVIPTLYYQFTRNDAAAATAGLVAAQPEPVGK